MKQNELPNWITVRTLLMGLAALGILVGGGAAARDQWFIRPAQETQAERLKAVEVALTGLIAAVSEGTARQALIAEKLSGHESRLAVIEDRQRGRRR